MPHPTSARANVGEAAYRERMRVMSQATTAAMRLKRQQGTSAG